MGDRIAKTEKYTPQQKEAITPLIYFFCLSISFKWIDEAQILIASIDRRKVQVHGQLDVGCRHFRRLLHRFFRFIAKDDAPMQVDICNTWNSTDVSVVNGRYKSLSL